MITSIQNLDLCFFPLFWYHCNLEYHPRIIIIQSLKVLTSTVSEKYGHVGFATINIFYLKVVLTLFVDDRKTSFSPSSAISLASS